MKWFLLACIASALAGVVTVDIEHKPEVKGKSGSGNSLFRNLVKRNSKRSSYYSEPLSTDFYAYYATIYMGSDKQQIKAQLDTGSSDLWVMSTKNMYCDGNLACNGMQFNPATSGTFTNTSIPWSVRYLDTTGAFGFLAQDTVSVAGASVTNAYFAVADVSNVTMNIFGVGFAAGEGTVSWNPDGTQSGFSYPNYPVSLKSQGLINTIAYSLYLNSPPAQQGVILFGGVDHAKYSGELSIVPMVNVLYPYVDQIFHFTVMLHGINVVSSGATCTLASNIGYPVVLDSGSTFGILPARAVHALSEVYNYTWNSDDGYFEGQCDGFGFDAIELNFSGVNLTVPLKSLIVPSGRSSSPCLLGIQPSQDITQFLLGDIFIRNFYIVYDLEHYQIALAQANFTDDTDVEEIVSTIPRAVSALSYFSTKFINKIVTHDVGSCMSYPTSTFTFVSSTSTPVSTANVSLTQVSSPTSSFHTNITAGMPDFTTNRTVRSSTAVPNLSPSRTLQNSSYFSYISTLYTVNASRSNSLVAASTAAIPINATSYYSVTSTPSFLSAESSNTSFLTIPSWSNLGFTSDTLYPHSNIVLNITSPTVLSTKGIAYSISSSTVLTVTDCDCTTTPESSVVPEISNYGPTRGFMLPLNASIPQPGGSMNEGTMEAVAWTNDLSTSTSTKFVSGNSIQPSQIILNATAAADIGSVVSTITSDALSTQPSGFSTSTTAASFRTEPKREGNTSGSSNQVTVNAGSLVTTTGTTLRFTSGTYGETDITNATVPTASGQHSIVNTNGVPSHRIIARNLIAGVIGFWII